MSWGGWGVRVHAWVCSWGGEWVLGGAVSGGGGMCSRGCAWVLQGGGGGGCARVGVFLGGGMGYLCSRGCAWVFLGGGAVGGGVHTHVCSCPPAVPRVQRVYVCCTRKAPTPHPHRCINLHWGVGGGGWGGVSLGDIGDMGGGGGDTGMGGGV